MAPLLSINNLSVKFSNDDVLTTAVSNISFEVLPGELVAVVGESGSGKSVTALSLLQLLPKQAVVNGEILFQQDLPVNLLQLSNKNR